MSPMPTMPYLRKHSILLCSMVSLTVFACRPAEKSDAQVWDDLCAASTFEDQYCEPEGSQTCYGEVIVPRDLYCSDTGGHKACPVDLASFEAEFSTCDEAEKDWPTCAWLRSEGCGTVQFEAPCDESCVERIAFDAEDGSFLGAFFSSDTPIRVCNADRLRVGEFNDYFARTETSCETIESTYCCDAN